MKPIIHIVIEFLHILLLLIQELISEALGRLAVDIIPTSWGKF